MEFKIMLPYLVIDYLFVHVVVASARQRFPNSLLISMENSNSVAISPFSDVPVGSKKIQSFALPSALSNCENRVCTC